MRTRKNRDERRAEIIEATAAILLKKGLKAATTRDVTARLGVGSGLLHHYFNWPTLRCLAFNVIAERSIEETFPEQSRKSARRIMRRFVTDTFARGSVPYLRVWIEAADEAPVDAALAKVLDEQANHLLQRLAELISRGNEEGAWQCADVQGAAWRILAAHDGLIGFVLVGAPRLSRRDAERHLRVVIANECPGAA